MLRISFSGLSNRRKQPERYPNLGSVLAGYLNSIPAKTRKPAFIPHLRDKVWATDMLANWERDTDTPNTVVNAIRRAKEK
jgi:hypothetical protein